MAFAYELYLDTKCGECGGSIFECRNPDNVGLYESLDTTCHRKAAVEERTTQQGFKAEPGQLFYAAPIDEELVSGSGVTLSTYAEADNQGD